MRLEKGRVGAAARVGALLVAGAWACVDKPRTSWEFPPEAGYDAPRAVLQVFTVRNTTDAPLSGVELWFSVPLQKTSAQVLRQVELGEPGVLKDGAGVVKLDLPPLGDRVVRVYVRVDQASVLQSAPADRAWLQPSLLVESEHAEVQRRARALVRDNTVETAKAIHGFVHGHLVEGGFDSVDRGAAYALQAARGDCSEYASLFAALARAAGLPARRVAGYRCAAQCRTMSYHSWAEFRDGARWVPVDAMRDTFDVVPGEYVALETAEEQVRGPMVMHHRYTAVPQDAVQVESTVEVQ